MSAQAESVLMRVTAEIVIDLISGGAVNSRITSKQYKGRQSKEGQTHTLWADEHRPLQKCE